MQLLKPNTSIESVRTKTHQLGFFFLISLFYGIVMLMGRRIYVQEENSKLQAEVHETATGKRWLVRKHTNSESWCVFILTGLSLRLRYLRMRNWSGRVIESSVKVNLITSLAWSGVRRS